jgi:hypothetical protein
MEIVVATHGFSGFGGTETYALTVAEHLQRLGHEATIVATQGGPMSDFALERGVRVVLGEHRLEAAPDVILVQDGALAYRLADRWPDAPQVFRACSDVYDFVLPPQLPGLVAAVVVASDRVARRVQAMAGDFEILRLRQPVDTARFAPRGELRRDRPRRAVLLGNYLNGRRRSMLVEAWERAGVECVAIGAYGDVRAQPEDVIAGADIVVGKARAIIDGMACGRAAYVYDLYGGDGWVTADGYAALEADNFGGQATDWALSEDRLAADIAAYRPEMGLVNRDLAVRHHAARDHVHALVALFERVVSAPVAPPAPLRELARLVRAQSATEFDLHRLQADVLARAGVEHAAELRAGAAEARAAQAEARAEELAVEVERLRWLLGTRRARAGLAVGRAADRVRGR